jgi:MFS family permease
MEDIQMDWLDSREKKIFLTVFLLIGIFIQWYGVNANSRYDLTRSIVEERDFEINEYYNNTGDRAFYEGNYYTDKAPGQSLIATPIYASWKSIYSIFGSTKVNKTGQITLFTVNNKDIKVSKSPGNFYLSSLILAILFTSTLSVSILSILVYRLSKDFIENENKRLIATFGFAFGSLITHYGTLFLPAASATLLSFSSFYLLYQWKDYPGSKKMILAGFLGGFGVIVKSSTAIILFANFVYSWHKYKNFPVFYTLGGFLGGLPYILYNTILFGAPWRLPRSFLDPALWSHLQQNNGFRLGLSRLISVINRVLFMPYRGIFYWFPFLIFSIPGAVILYQKKKRLAGIIGIVISFFLILTASWWAWWHGGWFGARLLVPIMPFLMIPLFYGIDLIESKKLLIGLLTLSILINMAGFSGKYEDMLKDRDNSSQMIDSAKKKVIGTQTLKNPVRDYYVSNFLQNGPESRALNGILNAEFPPDIRAYKDISGSYKRAPLIMLLCIIIGITTLIWKNNIRASLSKHRSKVLENTENNRLL